MVRAAIQALVRARENRLRPPALDVIGDGSAAAVPQIKATIVVTVGRFIAPVHISFSRSGILGTFRSTARVLRPA